MIKFSILSVATSTISLILFAVLLLAPQLIFTLFGISGNASAYFLARRAAMLFLGYAIITYLARHAEHSNIRQAVILGIGTAMLSLSALGMVELLRGFVSSGILFAVAAELLLAVAHLSLWFLYRREDVVA